MNCVKISSQRAPLTIALILYLILIPKSFAEIYQWEDENGKTHFGDTLPESRVKNQRVIKEQQPAALATGSAEDSERRQEQAKSWYKQRLEQSRIEDKELEKIKVQRAERNEIKKQNCERYKKKLSDYQQQLRAKKRAGIKPRHESQMRISIEQYKRDVDFYC